MYFHKLGDPPAADRYEIGRDFPKIAEIRLDAHPTRGYVTASVQHGDGGGVEQYLRRPDGTWQQLAGVSDVFSKCCSDPTMRCSW